MTASRAPGFVHGTGPSRAKSTLPTPSPNRNRPSSRRSGAGMRRPAMRSSAGTLVSNSTTDAAGRSAGPRSSRPVSIRPPWATRSAASASTIAWLPPRGTGQPPACPVTASASPAAAGPSVGIGRMVCAITPVSSAGASSVRQRRSHAGGALLDRPQPEAHRGERIRRDAQHRAEREPGDLRGPRDERGEQPVPRGAVRAEPVRGPPQVPPGERGAPVVERMRVRELRRDERHLVGQPEPAEERRGDRHRMHGRAEVVPEAGERHLGGPGAAADRLAALDDRDRQPGAGERHRGGEAVRAGAHDQRVGDPHRRRATGRDAGIPRSSPAAPLGTTGGTPVCRGTRREAG